jgi:hypothetical protein
MRGIGFLLIIALWAVLLATPAAAAPDPSTTAAGCPNRSDVAVLDEYCPTLPGADGRGTSRGPTLKSVLPQKVVKMLEEAGPAGTALLGLPAVAPKRALGHEGRGRGLDADTLLARGRLGHPAEPPGNPIKAASSATAKGDLGAMFGSLLLVSSFGLAGAAWMRFRRRRLS